MNEVIFISLTKIELVQMIGQAIEDRIPVPKPFKEILTLKEAAKLLGCSYSGLNKYKDEYNIPYCRFGKRIFFRRQDLIDSLKKNYFIKP